MADRTSCDASDEIDTGPGVRTTSGIACATEVPRVWGMFMGGHASFEEGFVCKSAFLQLEVGDFIRMTH